VKAPKGVGHSAEEFESSHGKLAVREREKLTEKIKESEAKLKRSEDALRAAEDIRHGVFALAEQDLAPPKWIEPIPRGKGKPVSMPVLLISDEQVGERVAAIEIEGVNHYDHKVYVQRHDLCAQKLVALTEHNMGDQKCPVALIAFLGDAISGEIHAELAETNSLQSVPSTALVVETRRNAINFWLKHFEKLFIIVLPGNHGRTTMKPRFKRYSTMNYETLIGWWLQSLYANEPRVKIVVPESGDYLLPVWGRGLFFTHGDRMGAMSGQGAGMGFAGRTLPIVRGSKNIREQQASFGRRIDFIHVGHWHERLEAAGTFANGTMAGYNEYAHGLRYVAAPAEQWCYFMNEEYGPTARWPIYLSKKPVADRARDITEIMK
jgi:hypothetical protein